MSESSDSSRQPARPDESPRAAEAHRLAEETEAIEENLRSYVDQRLEGVWRTVGEPPKGRRSWLERWRLDLYFAVVIALLVAIWLRQPQAPRAATDEAAAGGVTEVAAADDAPETTDPPVRPDDGRSGPPPVDAELRADATPDEQWQAFVRGNFDVVSAWLGAVSEARGLERPEEVSRLQKGFFEAWAGAADVEALDDLQAMRLGLFEYVYGRWYQGREPPPPGTWGRVDRVLSSAEYPPAALTLLLEELGLVERFPEPKVADEALHVAVIVTWLESHEP